MPGADGATGPIGPAGPQGLQGDPGADGADGTSVTIAGSVSGVGDLPGGALAGDLYIVAWRAYRSGNAVWMACRQSKFALMQGKMPLWPRIIGTLIIWPATGFWLIGHFLIFGTWSHWVFCDRLEGECMEAVPAEGEKSDHLFPPLLFKTRTRTLNDDH